MGPQSRDIGASRFTLARPGGALVLDAAYLEYVSSTGLRVTMRLVKRDRNISIINS
ncbi:MAG: hypothetical protein Q4B54_12685 [Coriobacteriales bacterium]|nr:hypothetical protein [Coriobacteriales bacterium]